MLQPRKVVQWEIFLCCVRAREKLRLMQKRQFNLNYCDRYVFCCRSSLNLVPFPSLLLSLSLAIPTSAAFQN